MKYFKLPKIFIINSSEEIMLVFLIFFFLLFFIVPFTKDDSCLDLKPFIEKVREQKVREQKAYSKKCSYCGTEKKKKKCCNCGAV